MAFEGNLDTLSFADLIQLLGSTRKTGKLVVSRRGRSKRIYLRDGAVLMVSSDDPDDFVSHTLVAVGKVSEAQMGEALEIERQSGRLLGKILVDRGWVTPEVLRRYLADRAYDIVAKLINWADAIFAFEEFELPRKEIVPLDLTVEELLMEGFRRVDEVSRFREVVPHEEIVLERTSEGASADVMDQTMVMLVLRKLEAPRSVRELRREIRTSEFSLLEGITRLIESGVLRTRARSATGPPPDAGWLQQARKVLLAGFYDRAVSLLRRGLAFEPENREARVLLEQAESAFIAEVTRKDLPLDGVPEVAVALEAVGDKSLTPAEAFVLSRVDGQTALETILEAVPLPPAEVLLTLRRLLRAGYIRVRVPAAATAE